MTERYYPGKFIREAYQTQKEKGGMEKRVFLKAAAEFLGLSLTASACKPFVSLTETPEPTPTLILVPTPTATPTLRPTETSLPAIYDPGSETFIERPGGINEKVLNLLPNPEYRTQLMLNYLQRVDVQEHKLNFSPIGEPSISMIETLLTAIKNMKLVEKLDKNDFEISSDYKNLKELIMGCNEVYATTEEGSLERVVRIYKIASEYLRPGEETPNSAVPIVDLANGRLGDCNDLAAAYFPLFNYYRARAYFLFGNVKGETLEGKKVTSSHGWIRLEVENLEFDLDPTPYRPFVPLEVRNSEIIPISIKDQFMRFKDEGLGSLG